MHLRVSKVTGANGTHYEYVRLVETYREAGKVKHRVVANLGRKDFLAEHWHDLARTVLGVVARPECAKSHKAELPPEADAWDYGPSLVVRHLWQELGLDLILTKLGARRSDQRDDFVERAWVLVANRLCCPGSEHGIAGWLETDFVCDAKGRRWVPCWRSEEERKASKSPRVRVEAKQLKSWYRTLDWLLDRKVDIEFELFARLRDLFSLRPELVFYDITSTYFEGHGPIGYTAYGHSRDGKPGNRQVVVGVVMVDGWPIAHHIFPGNWRDSNTVPHVLYDLQKRFNFRRVVFVGDRGMITADNVELLRSKGQGYIMGVPRRRRPDATTWIASATGPWTECSGGVTNSEKKNPSKTMVQEVESGEPGLRVFVVHSEDRHAYEKAMRERDMDRVRKDLDDLVKRAADGKIKDPAKVGAAAARVLSRHRGHRYYDWSYRNQTFEYHEHPTKLPAEKAMEGKYVLATEQAGLSAKDAVALYKELSEVERGFRCIKVSSIPTTRVNLSGCASRPRS